MKTVQKTIRDTMAQVWKRVADTPLHRHVFDWIEERAEEYQDDDTPAIDAIAGLLRDLQYGGCASGMVGHLIYYSDTDKFWAEYGRECAQIVSENAEDAGCSIGEMMNPNYWDESDPLALESMNRCSLCWAGFEETAYRIGCSLDIEL